MASNTDVVEVSVICPVYNHEPYLRRCLDGFVGQKTTFSFEIIVHDDKSTDRSAEIIREYESNFPDLFRPIYQKENQHSRKGVTIIGDCILPFVRGRYVAVCEGDDYWCDSHKLQLQYDYMETHPECSVCLHNTVDHDLSGRKPDRNFNNWAEIHTLSDRDIYMGGKVHTSSFFCRTEIYRKCFPDYGRGYWFGDLIRLACASDYGKAACLPQIMSVYNSHNPKGASQTAYRSGMRHALEARRQTVDFLMKFNERTQKRHDATIQERITLENVYMEYYSGTILLTELLAQDSSDKKQVISCAKKLSENDYTRQRMRERTGLSYWKIMYEYCGYQYGYPLWKWIMQKRVIPNLSL